MPIHVKRVDLDSPLVVLTGRTENRGGGAVAITVCRKPISHFDLGKCFIDWRIVWGRKRVAGHLEMEPEKFRHARALNLNNNIIPLTKEVKGMMKPVLR
jgi:hypothetical protein